MGGKSRSSSSSSTTTNTKNLNLQGIQGTQVFSDGGSRVEITDGGAIEGSLQIGRDAVEAATLISEAFINANQQTNERAIGLTSDIASGLDSYAGKLTELAKSAATDDTAETVQTMVKFAAGAVVLVAAFKFFGAKN